MLAVMRAYLEVDRRKRAEWASDNFINIRCEGDRVCSWIVQESRAVWAQLGGWAGVDRQE